MSLVTGVTLITSCIEEGAACWPAVQSWLEKHDFAPLAMLEDRYSGTKHPQLSVGGAGYNFFFNDEFAEFVSGRPWDHPEQVVLIMAREQEDASVYRFGRNPESSTWVNGQLIWEWMAPQKSDSAQ